MKVKSAVKTMASFPGMGVDDNTVLPYPFNNFFSSGVNLYKQGLDGVDAVVIWGGADISPSLYNEPAIIGSGPREPSKRDIIEWETVREAVARKILVIGICRGAQLLCAYAGGSLVQDVNGHHSEHFVETYTNSYLKVSSSHHQMMYPFNVEHQMLAWCSKPLSDTYSSGTIKPRPPLEPEVVWFPKIKGLAIQCHPEWHTTTAFNEWMFMEIEKRLCKC